MPTRLSLLLQSATITALASTGAFIVLTKHIAFEPYDPSTDPTFQSLLSSRHQHTPRIESCVRRIPLKKIDRSFLRDISETEGTLLAEAFVKGVFGGVGYAPKRLMGWFSRRGTDERQLWSRGEIEGSAWEVGTEVVGSWRVLARPPGMASGFVLEELKEGDGERQKGLLQVWAKCVPEQGYYEFRLRSVRAGTGREGALAQFAHRRYLEWLMETGVMAVEKIGKDD